MKDEDVKGPIELVESSNRPEENDDDDEVLLPSD